jgi:hypothetical protein
MPSDHLVAPLISAHWRADRESLQPDSVDQFDAVDTGKLLSGRREESICHHHRGRAVAALDAVKTRERNRR